MPFTVPENMRKEMAVAVSCANHCMVDGDFDYDYETGKIYSSLNLNGICDMSLTSWRSTSTNTTKSMGRSSPTAMKRTV